MTKVVELQKSNGTNLGLQETNLTSFVWDVLTFNDYSVGLPVRDPADSNYYINRTGVFTTTNPAADPTNWEIVLASNHGNNLPLVWTTGTTYAQGIFVIHDRKFWQKFSAGSFVSSVVPETDTANWSEVQSVLNTDGGSGQGLVLDGPGSTEIKKIDGTVDIISVVDNTDNLTINLADAFIARIAAIEAALLHPGGGGDTLLSSNKYPTLADNEWNPTGGAGWAVTLSATGVIEGTTGVVWEGSYISRNIGIGAANHEVTIDGNLRRYIIMGIALENEFGANAHLIEILDALSTGTSQTYPRSNFYMQTHDGVQLNYKSTDTPVGRTNINPGVFITKLSGSDLGGLVGGVAYSMAFELDVLIDEQYNTVPEFEAAAAAGLMFYEINTAGDPGNYNKLEAKVSANTQTIESNSNKLASLGTFPEATTIHNAANKLVSVTPDADGIEFVDRSEVVPTLPSNATTSDVDYLLRTGQTRDQRGVRLRLTNNATGAFDGSVFTITGSNTAFSGDDSSIFLYNNAGRSANGALEVDNAAGQEGIAVFAPSSTAADTVKVAAWARLSASSHSLVEIVQVGSTDEFDIYAKNTATDLTNVVIGATNAFTLTISSNNVTRNIQSPHSWTPIVFPSSFPPFVADLAAWQTLEPTLSSQDQFIPTSDIMDSFVGPSAWSATITFTGAANNSRIRFNNVINVPGMFEQVGATDPVNQAPTSVNIGYFGGVLAGTNGQMGSFSNDSTGGGVYFLEAIFDSTGTLAQAVANMAGALNSVSTDPSGTVVTNIRNAGTGNITVPGTFRRLFNVVAVGETLVFTGIDTGTTTINTSDASAAAETALVQGSNSATTNYTLPANSLIASFDSNTLINLSDKAQITIGV